MEPITAVAIATLAFTKAFEKTIELSTESAWNTIDKLREMIGDKIKSWFPKNADKILQEADNGSEKALESIGNYLNLVMTEEPEFAEELKKLFRQIKSSKVITQVGARDLTEVELKDVEIKLTAKNPAERIEQTGIEIVKHSKIEGTKINLEA